MTDARRTGDERMDAQMGRLLQVGVLVASATVLVGGVLFLSTHARARTAYGTFHGEPVRLREVAALVGGVRHGDAAAVIQVGVLLLIATPIARVVFAVVAFLRERDWLYVAVSVAVLGVLLVGLVR